MTARELTTYQQLVEFVLKNGGVAIAEFYTTWSGPCKLIAPTLEECRKDFAVPLGRIDTDKAHELSNRFDIHALPTYILLRKAEGDITKVGTVVSAHPQRVRKLFQTGYSIKNNQG